MEVQEPIAPLHEGTQAIIRATSLSGVANRYIALTPGPQNMPKLDDKAQLGQDTTTTIIDLDQLVNTLDEPTRQDLQKVIKGFATQLGGQGKAANEAARYFNPVLSTSRRLVGELTEDEGTLTDLLLNASKLSTALADRRDDLTSLVSNTERDGVRDRRGGPVLRPRAAGPADDAAPRQHHLRQPPRRAGRPQRPRRRLQARHEGPRPVPAPAAPARRRHAARPIADLRTLVSRKGPEQRPGGGHAEVPAPVAGRGALAAPRHPGAQPVPQGRRLLPPLHA